MDNIIVTRDGLPGMKALKTCLLQEFEVKNLSMLNYFIGTEMAHSQHEIFIYQQKHLLNLLTKTMKRECKLVETPIKQNHKLCKALEDVIS